MFFGAAGYILMIGDFALNIPRERVVGSPPSEAVRRIYLEVVGVDAFRDAMQVRVSVEPPGIETGGRLLLPDKELTLVLSHDDRIERVEIHPHQPPPATVVELDLYGGDVSSYPRDAYRAGLTVQCVEAPSSSALDPSAASLPLQLTVWDRVFGYRLRTGNEPDADMHGERLSFAIRRDGAFMFFAFAVYGAMVALASVAISIGTLAFLRIRRPEPTLVGALGAIVFALPALRNTLPGAPPLGIMADLLIYLWAELAAVLALTLLVSTWARTGPRPDGPK